MQAAQDWLTERLEGLEPIDFEEGVRFISTSNLQPPQGFQDVWLSLSDDLTLTREESSEIHAIVIFCNPYIQDELDCLPNLVQYIDGLGRDAPPMFWAPHTQKFTGEPDDLALDFSTSPMVTHLLELGLDGIIPDEPVGFHLALAVRAKIHKSASLSQTLNDMVNERRSRIHYAEYLKDCIHCMLWDYLRIRLTPSIPAIDSTLPAGEPRALPGYTFGQLLGRGMFGCVYRLHHQDNRQRCNEVVKSVEKSGVKEIQDLKCMKRMIDVMVLLGSPTWQHPNVVQLYQTYHTPTHILFRMENGGPENLYRRLSYRQKLGNKQRPMHCEKVCSLISQAVEVMRHLHVGPHVCHRDIKPENFIVSEPDEDRIILKVADFDLAIIQEGNQLCRSPCGTVPFTAPEVVLEREYDGFAADTWSLGTVILEVLCGVRLVEQSLNLVSDNGNKTDGQDLPPTPPEVFARKTQQAFSEANFTSNLLRDNIRSELQEILGPMRTMLDGMLTTQPRMRWNISQAKEVIVDAGIYLETSVVFGGQN